MSTHTRRALLGALTLALVASAVNVPTATALARPPEPAATEPLRLVLPRPTGPYPIGSTELHLVDQHRADPWRPERRRELMVSLWYPARPGGGQPVTPYLPAGAAQRFGVRGDAQLGLAPGRVDWPGINTHARTGAPVRTRPGGHPVVLFSPGGGVPRALGTVLVEELASRGYVVVTVDHTYETPEVEFPGGRIEVQHLPEGDPTGLNHALIRTRVGDTRFVLDQLAELAAGRNPDAESRRLPDGLVRALDLSRVGMFGHSAGGFTTAETMLVDRRVDAGINMDGSMAYSFSTGDLGEVTVRGLDRPFLLMGAGVSGGVPHTHRDAVDWAAFWAHSTGWQRDLYIPHGEHFTFTDYPALIPQLERAFDLPPGLVTDSIGTVDPTRITSSLRAYVTAFFEQHLRHRPQPLLDRPSPAHPDITHIPA
ncbi:alpha/beta hydrolase family protein [Micromonospora sp. NPDC050397]|uniref:alpha/beta hydrolase family protein n=1 Tax=Micromonospora sp. NPDC050397 TaxID=3364279 RepID=UPI00384F3BA5